MTLKRVLIMAGGTGGHVFPGLALANYLRDNQVDVHWLGTPQGIESQLVADANIPMHAVNIQGLRGKGFKTMVSGPWKITKAIMQSVNIMRSIRPDVVVGMGGFVSGPGGMAAWMTRTPLIIHEQNAKAGMTNKVLGRFAARILEGFPLAFKPHKKVVAVGNPVRHEITRLPEPSVRLDPMRQPFRLLILGGSLGAQALNEIVPKALANLPEAERPEIWHQTGEKHYLATKNLYESMGLAADLHPFIKDMANAYAWADMVLCRAGALTIAELCAAGLGAILVPYPHAVDDHQTANAEFMVTNHAAICVQQTDLTVNRLTEIVKSFSKSPKERFAMALAAYELRKVNVTQEIYKICQEVCR